LQAKVRAVRDGIRNAYQRFAGKSLHTNRMIHKVLAQRWCCLETSPAESAGSLSRDEAALWIR